MPVSAVEVTFIIILIVILSLVIWWYVDKIRKINGLKGNTYTRGANIVGSGNKAEMKCGVDHKISVYKAVQICSNPDVHNYEDPSTDPIASGVDGVTGYGEWDPTTTVDLTDTMGKSVNGKQNVTYTFTATSFPSDMSCPADSTQLIATYDCIPK